MGKTMEHFKLNGWLFFLALVVSAVSAEEIKLERLHQGGIRVAVSDQQQAGVCRVLKSARNWIGPRWPVNQSEQSLAPNVRSVLEGVRNRIILLNTSSRTTPKTTFTKLAGFLAEKECLSRGAIVRPAAQLSGLERDRFLLEKVFCQDDGKGGFVHVHSFECVKLP